MSAAADQFHSVVLSGGAAYAAYEIGVMSALFRGASPSTAWEPIEPLLYSGTSAGSFNAAMMASLPELPAFAAVEFLRSVWLNQIASGPNRCGNGVYRIRGDVSRFVDPSCFGTHPLAEFDNLTRDARQLADETLARTANFFAPDQSVAARVVGLFNLSSFVDTAPFRETLDRLLRPASIRASFRRLSVAVTNWRRGTLHLFGNEDMTDASASLAVMASSSIPGFFPPVQVDGHLYVDGGVLMNTPLKPAIEAGSDVIHLIYLDPDVDTIPLAALQNISSTFDRMLVTQRADLIDADVDRALKVNQALEALESLGVAGSRLGGRASALYSHALTVLRLGKDGNPHRKVTIHRYHPRQDLGGIIGTLNFDHDRIERMIAKGYQDTVDHDCGEAGCVMPDGKPAPRRFPSKPPGSGAS